MKTLIIIFIVVAVIVGVFGVGFVCYDAAAEKRRAKKAAEEAKKQPVPQPVPVVHYIPVAAKSGQERWLCGDRLSERRRERN